MYIEFVIVATEAVEEKMTVDLHCQSTYASAVLKIVYTLAA